MDEVSKFYCRRCGGIQCAFDEDGDDVEVPREEQCDCFKVTCPHCGKEFDR
jgi:hypothetical protein